MIKMSHLATGVLVSVLCAGFALADEVPSTNGNVDYSALLSPDIQWESPQVFVINQSASNTSKEDIRILTNLRREQLKFQNSLNALVKEYAGAKDAKAQDRTVKKIRTLVYDQVTRELAQKRQLLKLQMARIQEIENRIDSIEKNKMSYVDESVQYLTSPDAISQMQRASQGGVGSGTIIKTSNR
jgi:hypothetical protein